MNIVKRVLVLSVFVATGVCSAATESKYDVEVLNPERTLKEYLIWTPCRLCFNTLPPSLHPTEGFDHHAIGLALARLACDGFTRKYFTTYAEAIDFANEKLIGKPAIAPDDLKRVHSLIVDGETERSPLRTEDGLVNRYGIHLTDLGALDVLLHTGTHSDSALLKAFSKGKELQRDWVGTYVHILKSFDSEEIACSEIVSTLKDADKALADRLFDTDLPTPAELDGSDVLGKLCAMLNETFGLTADPACFDDAYCRAGQIFLFVVKQHPFSNGNGRLARFLANIVLVRAGLLPVVQPVDQYDMIVQLEMNASSSLQGKFITRGLKKASQKVVEWWKNMLALSPEDMSGLLKGTVIHPIIDYEDRLKEK